MIPRIIHQSWRSEPIPAQYEAFVQSWKQIHPDWEYRFWTDEDNLQLVRTEYAWLLPTYTAYPFGIQRADLARVLYMHRYGGLYVDLDFECFRPFDELIQPGLAFMGREKGGLGWYKRRRDYACNALLASPAGHPFWESVLHRMVEAARPQRRWELRTAYVLATTGPEIMDRAIEEYERDDLTVFPSDQFYAASAIEKDPETRRSLAHSKQSHAVHHFANTWFSNQMHLVMWLGYAGRRLLTWMPQFAAARPTGSDGKNRGES